MKRKFGLQLALLIILIAGVNHFVAAQLNYKIEPSDENLMKLSGTSTLHNWEMQTSKCSGDVDFSFASNDKVILSDISGLNFTITVTDLKSDNKGLDKNAYQALKSDQFPVILYLLTSTTITPTTENNYVLTTVGNLTITGVTQEINMRVNCRINNVGMIVFSGSHSLKMSDYKIEPPIFMFGAMKTGDNVTLNFKVSYIKQS